MGTRKPPKSGLRADPSTQWLVIGLLLLLLSAFMFQSRLFATCRPRVAPHCTTTGGAQTSGPRRCSFWFHLGFKSMEVGWFEEDIKEKQQQRFSDKPVSELSPSNGVLLNSRLKRFEKPRIGMSFAKPPFEALFDHNV